MTDRRLWYALGLVAALAAVLGGYYFVHKPVTPAQAAALASVLADAGGALLLTLLGGGLGHRLLRGWLTAGDQPIAPTQNVPATWIAPAAGERAALHAALGWGVMGLAMLGLGVLRLYYPLVLWALTLAALALLWRDIRAWLSDALHALKALWYPDRLAVLAGLFVLFVLALGLPGALAPPLKWDALVYHLALPKLYAQAHGIGLGADFFFSGMPQLTEMLYTAALLLRGAAAAQTLGWAFGAVLALGLAARAFEVLGPRFALVAPAVLFSSFTLAISLSWAYADWLLMLLALALLVALRQWRLSGERRWLWLGGVLSGLAVGCKYTGVIVPLAGAAVIALAPASDIPAPPIPDTHPRPPLARPVSFLLLALLVFSPWLIKNWIFSGSPVYPLLVPAGHVDALRLWFYNRPDLMERNPVWATLIFLRAVFLGVQGGNGYDATLGPLFVFLPVGLVLGWPGLEADARRELRPVAVFALAGYLVWVLLTFISSYAVQARLFFAVFPALALLCAGGLAAIARFDSPRLRISLVVNAALALVLGLSALEIAADFASRSPIAYLAGLQSASDYRLANLGWYAAALDRVNALPVGSRVAFLWEPRSLECARPERCEPDVIIDRWWHLRRTAGTASAVISVWKAQGITHILVYERGATFVRGQPDNPFAEADWAEFDALRRQMPLVEDFGGVYSLYALP